MSQNFNEERFRKLFPNASKSCLAANVGLPHPKFERDAPAALDVVQQRETKSATRFAVRFISRRVRPIDTDNLVGGCKPLIDCLRAASLIPNDDPASITLVVDQERVSKRKDECTIVEIVKL